MNIAPTGLANLQAWSRWHAKEDGWITADLRISFSSRIGRLFWTIVGKQFAFIRKFYGIDLQQ